MKQNCKILIAYHKKSELIKSNIMIPIHVGRDVMIEKSKDGKLSKKSIDWLLNNLIGDNTGDNISNLNRYFNEMSAIYWGWKNQVTLDNPEYIGLMHYRRHFIFDDTLKRPNDRWLMNAPVYKFNIINSKYIKSVLNEKILNDLLDKYTLITTKKYNANFLDDGDYYANCKERFAKVARVDEKWYEIMENIIKTYYPQYNEELKELSQSPTHYLCNMFIMHKDLFNEYCEFAFDVLFKVYDQFHVQSSINTWEARAIGFLAEFITSMFISHYAKLHPTKIKELDLSFIENTDDNFLIGQFKVFLKRIFSIKNENVYKKITILGFDIKIKNKKREIIYAINKLNSRLTKALQVENYKYASCDEKLDKILKSLEKHTPKVSKGL